MKGNCEIIHCDYAVIDNIDDINNMLIVLLMYAKIRQINYTIDREYYHMTFIFNLAVQALKRFCVSLIVKGCRNLKKYLFLAQGYLQNHLGY